MPTRPSLLPTLILAMFVVAGGGLAAQAPESGSSGTWAEFGALLEGAWEGTDSRHEVEWGVGGLVLKTRSYFGEPGAWRLVSEGFWFWDPTAAAVRGVSVAIEMPVSVFEYTSRVEGSSVTHELVTHGEMGGRYVERWEFEGDGYTWQLEQNGARLAGGSYRRAP